MDLLANQVEVAAARAEFLRGRDRDLTGVSDVVAASWQRSVSAGVSADAFTVDYHDDLDTASRLVRCAAPVVDRLVDETSDLALVVALTDSQARILTRRETAREIAHVFDRINLAPGFGYAESGIGTNGVGTVLESGQSVSVVGAEHFHERLQTYACTGAPIIDPITGRIEGILDISSLSHRWSPLMHSLVRSAARDIGHNLLVDRSPRQQALFEAYVRADLRTRHAVLVIGSGVEMVNARAGSQLTAEERTTLGEQAEFLCHRGAPASTDLVLDTGKRVRLRGSPVSVGDENVGVVLTVEILNETGARGAEPKRDEEGPGCGGGRAARASAPAPGSSDPRVSRSPAWKSAMGELTAALAARENTLVLGETGSGKFSLVLSLFHELHPSGRSLSFDAASFDKGDHSGTTVSSWDATEPSLCVFRNIDELTAAGVDRLDRFITELLDGDGHVHVVATLSDARLEDELPFRQLLPQFAQAVTLPGIRFRTGDIPDIVRNLLMELAPERDVRVSSAAMSAITRYSWPRNIGQLREALKFALGRRPVGTITADDLPPYCFAEARFSLSGIERTERDAIVAALRECDGNRVRAAEQLGISRSSLYRKLSRYGITTL